MPGSPDWNKLLDTYGFLEILERCDIDEKEVLIHMELYGYDFSNLKEPIDV